MCMCTCARLAAGQLTRASVRLVVLKHVGVKAKPRHFMPEGVPGRAAEQEGLLNELMSAPFFSR